jgi:predicted MPP superfamily phosphohydrolase
LLTRRRFLKLCAGAVTTAGAGYAWRIEPHWLEIVERPLPIAGLPVGLAGKKLVQISDLHVGPIVDDRYLTRALRLVASLRPDIVVVTGDFMTYEGEEQFEQVSRVLTALEPGRMATLGILGNHDYGPRWSDAVIADALVKRLRTVGIDVLRNTCRDVDGLQFLGLDDLWSPNCSSQMVSTQIDGTPAALVLCHNPDAVDGARFSSYRGWILSGHTHGGQCKPPFFAPPLLPVSNRHYVAGAYDLADGRKLYINRGLGYLMRVRFNARPEVTVFSLEREVPSKNHRVVRGSRNAAISWSLRISTTSPARTG